MISHFALLISSIIAKKKVLRYSVCGCKCHLMNNVLTIKNFGPIKNERSTKINICKITAFCGGQGTGKSSAAKLISEFFWLEKALNRGDFPISELTMYDRFRKKYCSFYGIQNYFKEDTYIQFYGDKYLFEYKDKHLFVRELGINIKNKYERPQIMYIPAERNFISSVENADKIRKLSGTLSTMMDDYFQALKQSKGTISLPVDGYSVTYDKLNKLTWLAGNDFKIRLQEAASGFQSLIPMMIVSNYLLNQIIENKGENILNLKSVEERERITKNIQKILKDKELDDSIRLELIKQYQTELYNHHFINIVEEPEQNLFPKSQRNVLNELLRINNSIKGNLFIFTTHSPYIINYLTLAVKAGMLYHGLLGVSGAKEKIEKIVPEQSAVLSKDVVIYQFTEDGEIKLLPKYESLPSDDNFLNNSLFESNQLFEQLLEIEDEYKIC